MTSTKKAVIATVAEDRPGLVSELSELVGGLNLNIEDSRMTVLGGEFAVLMSVSGDEASLTRLEQQLDQRAASGGFVYLYRRTGDRAKENQIRLRVTIEAMDHPGIVHRVAAFFSGRGANIRELTTETQRAAHTGSPVFNLEMEVELAASAPLEPLTDAFQGFCEQESLDGELIAP